MTARQNACTTYSVTPIAMHKGNAMRDGTTPREFCQQIFRATFWSDTLQNPSLGDCNSPHATNSRQGSLCIEQKVRSRWAANSAIAWRTLVLEIVADALALIANDGTRPKQEPLDLNAKSDRFGRGVSAYPSSSARDSPTQCGY